MPGSVVQAFAKEIAFRDVRRLETYLADHIAARFDIAGDLVGRNALLGFWRRLFQTYSLFELHILKCVAYDDLVIAESAYLLASAAEASWTCAPSASSRSSRASSRTGGTMRIWRRCRCPRKTDGSGSAERDGDRDFRHDPVEVTSSSAGRVTRI